MKEDILIEVFNLRIGKIQQALRKIDKNNPDANARLEAFIDSLLAKKNELSRYGCPNGSLAYELGKNKDETRHLSRTIFELIRKWLIKQFLDIGNTKKQSEELSMELFTRGQGICVLAQVYNDTVLFENEANKLKILLNANQT
jgi:AcrR family transcriptional regulator